MANNPYVNKVVYGGTTLIDLTDATCTADKILQGYTAYGASGEKLVGTASGGGSVIPSDLPSDGKTRICYKIPVAADAHGKTITLMYYHSSSSSSTKIDWGDGTSSSTITGSGRKTNTHTYSNAGSYIVTITRNAGNYYFGGGSSYTIYGAYNAASTIYQRNYIQWVVLGSNVTQCASYAFGYCYSLQEIRFPASGLTTIGTYAFTMCTSLKSVVLPNTVTSLGNYAFHYCMSLEKAVLPDNSTLKKIPDYCFRYCFSLKDLTIPSRFNAIGQYAFGSCYVLQDFSLPTTITAIEQYTFSTAYGLVNLSIPDTVTSIAANAFENCACLQKIRFNRATPPTVANSSAFTGIPTSCIISVPTGSLTAYKNATNYPSSSSYTYVEEAA